MLFFNKLKMIYFKKINIVIQSTISHEKLAAKYKTAYKLDGIKRK